MWCMSMCQGPWVGYALTLQPWKDRNSYWPCCPQIQARVQQRRVDHHFISMSHQWQRLPDTWGRCHVRGVLHSGFPPAFSEQGLQFHFSDGCCTVALLQDVRPRGRRRLWAEASFILQLLAETQELVWGDHGPVPGRVAFASEAELEW